MSRRALRAATGLLQRKVLSTTAPALSGAPPPAGGESRAVGQSNFLLTTREAALATPGIIWKDEEPTARRGLTLDDEVLDDVRASRQDGQAPEGRQVKKLNTYQSIRSALATQLGKDETAVVFGEDVQFGGVFRCTVGLAEEFGAERVFNTPLTEQGIAGFGIGLAAMGQTAIAECQFADYIFPAFDQLVNEAAKYRFRSGGQFDCGSFTMRSPCMAVGHGGLYHSQSVEAYFQQAAGLKVVIPRSPIQARGLLLASIRDPNPVIFLEPKILYRSAAEMVPVDDYELPLGVADVMQEGEDLTIVSWGTPLYTIESALRMLAQPSEQIASLIPEKVRPAKIELIDLRTTMPYDAETVVNSVKKTGRLVIVHEANRAGGVGADLAAEVQERCFLHLEAPIKRITGWDAPFPLSMEKLHVPDELRILDGIVETLQY